MPGGVCLAERIRVAGKPLLENVELRAFSLRIRERDQSRHRIVQTLGLISEWVDCGGQVTVRRTVRKYARTVRYVVRGPHYCAPSVNKNGGGYGYGGDVVIGGGGFIGSPAAVAQARRRASASVAFSGGSYGYVGEPAYYNGDETVVLQKRHKRKRLGGSVYYRGYSSYNSGVVLHYGPAIMKDGAY